MRDPVLDRQMFRKSEEDTPDSGVTSLVSGESDYDRRKRLATEMIATAKEKQNPENFKTLAEQSRPGVFRPVATGQPQAPQPNTQQQMAQMQAMGFRPVGMADGGYVQHFADGSGPEGVRPTIPIGANAIYSMPDVGLRIGKTGTSAITFGPTADEYSPAREGEQQRSPEGNIYMRPPATWSDEDIEKMADQFFLVEQGRYKESTAKTPIGRGIQSLNPFRNEPDRESLVEDLKQKRDIALRYKGEEEGAAAERTREEGRGKAMRENRVPSIFEESAPGVREEAMRRQQEAIRAAEDAVPAPETPQPQGGQPTEGIGSLAGFAKARAAARDVYEAPATKPKAAEVPEEKKTPTTNMQDLKAERAAAEKAAARNEDFNMALIQAGLAMAGGESPNALKNIAAGGLSGIGAFTELQKNRRASALAERELAAKEDYYGLMKSKMADSEARRADQSRIAMANSRIRGQQAADNAYNKWLTTTEGQMAKDDVRGAKYQTLLDTYTKSIYNDYMLGGSGSNNADPLGLLGSSEE